MIRLSILLCILIGCFTFHSCNGIGNKDESVEVKQFPTYDQNLAYSYIEKQVSFGPRVPNTPAHKACAEWIGAELKKYADTVYYQDFEAVTYDGKKQKGRNILAKFNAQNPNRILLSAHWDSRPIADHDVSNQNQPILGADDGGSGVAVVLAILHSLKNNSSKIGVDVVFFDIEDYGQPENSGLPPMENSWCLGSQYWGRNYTEMVRPRWGLLFDMVGAGNATFYREEISMLYASNLVNRLWNHAAGLGYGQYFIQDNMGSIQDDHLYINTLAQIPTADIINYKKDVNTFGAHWHTHKDNISAIDKKTLEVVGKATLSLIYEEEKMDTP